MALTDYLHGVEYVQSPHTITPVEFPRSGVIGLVGTAPIHMVAAEKQSLDEPIVVSSFRRAIEHFGPISSATQGFTIPQALEVIYQQGVSLVVVVNVFDPENSAHYLAVTAEAVALLEGKAEVAQDLIYDVVVKSGDGSTTYVLDNDYTLDRETGVITRVPAGSIPAADSDLTVDYKYANTSGVTDADIIGTVTAAGKLTGMLAWKESFHRFGYNPRLLAAPGYSYSAGVSSQMVSVAEELLAHAAIDAPLGATVSEVIAGRNDNTGLVKNFFHSDRRAVLCYPHLANVHGDMVPLSAYWVGVAAATQDKYGYHWSPSNKPIKGVTDTELPLTASYTSSNTDVQLLNEVGIVTVYGLAAVDSFAAGYRMWGNRSSAYPAATDPATFIVIRIIEDQLRIALERALLQYVDRPLSATVISFILQTINAYISRQVSMNILIGGQAFWDEQDNPADQLALGHIKIRLDEAGPPPLERITILARYNADYLAKLSREVMRNTIGSRATGGLPTAV